jgi:hydroxymethylpyrimidine/phosphomethylpyrimidine kinase
MKHMKYFLTIAATDNSGGAGIQQDLKVANEHGYWGLSAVTGITSQNFNSIFEIQAVEPKLLQNQIEKCLLSYDVSAIKIGAICSAENINVIASCLKKFHCNNVILDPVISSSRGMHFLGYSSIEQLKNTLFPLTTLITPNKQELEMLTGCTIHKIEDSIELAKFYCNKWNTSILLKGGHYDSKKIREALVTRSELFMFERDRKIFRFDHGTGCVLSSALACHIGNKVSLYDSCNSASQYLVNYYSELQKRFI